MAAGTPGRGRGAPHNPNASPAGTVRPSQLISSFGPGSLVQTRNDSVVIMGPDSWAEHSGHYKVIHHAYLEALLDKTHFRMPYVDDRKMVVSCRSFPTWGVCSNPACKALQPHRDAPPRGRAEFRCDLCKSSLYPARFIVMCERGHLDDFPWREWAHSESNKECDDPHPVLRMRARGRSTALSDYYVRCDSCGASRSCGSAVSRDGLDGIVDRCSGLSPWLGGRADECAGSAGGNGPGRPRGVQTLSTSLYYPSTVSALYIPRMLHEVRQFIAEHKAEVDSALDMNPADDVAERHSLFAGLRERYAAGEIADHIRECYRPTSGGARITKAFSEADIRRIEYDDLTAHESFRAGDYLEIASSPLGAEASEYLSSLRVVGRLTEIRVVRSFTRGVAPDPYSTEEAAETHYCRISRDHMKWYPAVENRGEGILFSLSEERLRRWEGRPDVAARCAPTIRAVGQWVAERGWRRSEASPRYMLIHTVSHLLARELALGSGYSEASIRERLYCGDGYSGMLLYTASPSSDGSLGGLARQGEPGAFWDALRSAVRRSRRCSGDPLCSDDDPALKEREAGMPPVARLNGSACYACALLPETSCENANWLLDRALVADDSLGFFSGLE